MTVWLTKKQVETLKGNQVLGIFVLLWTQLIILPILIALACDHKISADAFVIAVLISVYTIMSNISMVIMFGNTTKKQRQPKYLNVKISRGT
jgi:hypothetical protein